mgnify:CR=1 FL=1
MIINIKVKLSSKESGVAKVSDNTYFVKVISDPIYGKANSEAIKLLAKYFNTPQSNIKIIKGLKSKNKIVEVRV